MFHLTSRLPSPHYQLSVMNSPNLSGVVIDWYIKQKCCSCHTSVPHCHAAVGANKVSALKILVELASKDITNSENLLRNLQLPGELSHLAKPRWQIGWERILGPAGFRSIFLSLPDKQRCATELSLVITVNHNTMIYSAPLCSHLPLDPAIRRYRQKRSRDLMEVGQRR